MRQLPEVSLRLNGAGGAEQDMKEAQRGVQAKVAQAAIKGDWTATPAIIANLTIPITCYNNTISGTRSPSDCLTRPIANAERSMTIFISKQTTGNNAPAGTIIGVLSAKQNNTVIPCTFTLLSNPNNYFAISGNNLVTVQSGPLATGQYQVQVNAMPTTLSVWTTFTISVT